MAYLATLDAGASEIKATLFDASGQEVASAARDCPSDSPSSGWAQCAPEVLTHWPLEILKEAVSKSGIASSDVKTIGVTGSRATILPMDRDRRALGPVIFWYDRRSQDAVEEIGKRLGSDSFSDLTGVPLDPTPSVTKIMWLRDEQPRIYASTSVFAVPQSVVLNTLTGSGWYCDHSYGSYFGFMDVRSKNWNEALLALAGISTRQLPRLVTPGSVIGTLCPFAAEQTGLDAETKVVASGSDAACFKLGAGVEGTGIASVYIGTAGVVGVITDNPILDRRLTCCPSALPGYWDADGLLLTGGSAYRWLRDLLSNSTIPDAALDFKELDAMAAKIPPGSDGVVVVPHLAGAGTPLWNPEASGIILGLRLSHGRAHLARAVLEGVSFALRHALEALQEFVSPIHCLQLTGGGGCSVLWPQIIANVTGIPVSVPRSRQSTSLGAAIMAGVAVGIHSDYHVAIRAMSNTAERFDPDESARSIYETGYQSYLRAISHSAN